MIVVFWSILCTCLNVITPLFLLVLFIFCVKLLIFDISTSEKVPKKSVRDKATKRKQDIFGARRLWYVQEKLQKATFLRHKIPLLTTLNNKSADISDNFLEKKANRRGGEEPASYGTVSREKQANNFLTKADECNQRLSELV